MPRAFLAAVLLCAVPAVARAEEAAVTEVRTELDSVEKDLAGVKAGDVAAANPLIVRIDRKSTRLNSSHSAKSRMPSSA